MDPDVLGLAMTNLSTTPVSPLLTGFFKACLLSMAGCKYCFSLQGTDVSSSGDDQNYQHQQKTPRQCLLDEPLRSTAQLSGLHPCTARGSSHKKSHAEMLQMIPALWSTHWCLARHSKDSFPQAPPA